MWWRFLNHSVKEEYGVNFSCYVCTYMPHSVQVSSAFSPVVMSWEETRCVSWATDFKSYGNLTKLTYEPVNTDTATAVVVMQGDNLVAVYRYNLTKGQLNSTNVWRRLVTTVTTPLSFSYVIHPRAGITYPICYQSVCSEEKSNCYPGFSVGTMTACNHTIYAASIGSVTIPDVYWLCGHTAYASLPTDWSGVCTPILLTMPMHMYNLSEVHQAVRTKRSAAYTSETYVPHVHKIIGGAENFFTSVISPLGVSTAYVWLNSIHYKLMLFINDTILAADAVKEELTSIRLMVLQNHMVLDTLTAAQGGVCAMMGDSCCTFIPANDEESGNLSLAIQAMKDLRKDMLAERTTNDDLDLISWLEGVMGTGGFELTKMLIPVIIVCLILCSSRLTFPL